MKTCTVDGTSYTLAAAKTSSLCAGCVAEDDDDLCEKLEHCGQLIWINTDPNPTPSDAALSAINIAGQKLRAARRDLDTALAMLVEATAKDCVARGVPYDIFLKACVNNAHSARAQWSGGPDAPDNIIETATRAAWIEAACDINLSILFKKGK